MHSNRPPPSSKWGVISKNEHSLYQGCFAEKGFVLLEALVAMSLVAGAWMALIEIYQGLALRQGQLHSQEIELRKQSDAFEMSEYLESIKSEAQHDSSRLPDRSHAQHDFAKPVIHKRRKIASQANGV